MSETHEWFVAEFNYATWTECVCGFRPTTQEAMDAHPKQGVAA